MPLKLFVDFDGTIAANDVSNSLFRTFGGEECDRHVREYRAGMISARECFRRETNALGCLPHPEAEEFIDGQPPTPGAAELFSFCRERKIEIHVVSDGLDFVVDRFMKNQGIAAVSRFANAFTFDPASGRAEIAFPYGDAECDRCACCKRNIILTRAADTDIIGYVGEGYSDRCPAQYADIVFAKDELQTFCQRENISYYPYTTFFDVTRRLEELLARTTPRKRKRADLRRKEAFERES